jgi:hypothetical protein
MSFTLIGLLVLAATHTPFKVQYLGIQPVRIEVPLTYQATPIAEQAYTCSVIIKGETLFSIKQPPNEEKACDGQLRSLCHRVKSLPQSYDMFCPSRILELRVYNDGHGDVLYVTCTEEPK